jgi:hypothetical protein
LRRIGGEIVMTTNELPSSHTIEVERTASNARILEIVFGIFATFGMGWLYAGNYIVGIIALAFSIFLVFPIEAALVVGSGTLCLCIILPVNIAIAFLSGNNARAWSLSQRQVSGSVLRVILGVLVAFIAYGVLGTILVGIVAGFLSTIVPDLP